MSYYTSPRFLDKLAVHITKNFLDLPGVKVPLILGIHGRKGEGKTFQCELVFEQMGIEAVHMSAGELESPDAGDPARLIRLRYREAAEQSRVRGRMTALMINDIDAGMGRVDQFTQYTVNTQLVAGTLMNIADNPTNVQLPGSYDAEPIQRIPIIVTGNDFSTLYAPLIRDGRMEKFYWEPDRSDRIGIVKGIFAPDRLSQSDVDTLVDTFPDQSIDFFSALHSRLYDEQIRQFIHSVGISRISQRVVNSTEKTPQFQQPNVGLSQIVDLGRVMVQEQQRIQELQLVRQYNTPSADRLPDRSPNRPLEQTANRTAAPVPDGWSGAGDAARSQSRPAPSADPPPNGSNGYSSRTSTLNPEALQHLKGLLRQGHRVGIEYVDQRRFRINSWQCYAIVGDEAEAIATLESCLNEHGNDYVRLVGISGGDRHRISEAIIHRP